MPNLKIFGILVFFITMLVVGLEWLPKSLTKPVLASTQGISTNTIQTDKERSTLLQDACLKCHSLKYNDDFAYKPEVYKEAHKAFDHQPMDISLVSKIYTKGQLAAILQTSHIPTLELSPTDVQTIVNYLFEDKNKTKEERVGYFVVGFFLLLSLLLYIKILLQRSTHKEAK